MSKTYKVIIITSIIWLVVILSLEIFYYIPKENRIFNKGLEAGRDWVEKDIMWSNSFSFLNNLTCTSVPCSGGYYCYTLNCTRSEVK